MSLGRGNKKRRGLVEAARKGGPGGLTRLQKKERRRKKRAQYRARRGRQGRPMWTFTEEGIKLW
jgi:hypothetical protein